MMGGIDRTSISSFINGKTNSMNILSILNLAKALNVSIDDLCNKTLKIELKFDIEENVEE